MGEGEAQGEGWAGRTSQGGASGVAASRRVDAYLHEGEAEGETLVCLDEAQQGRPGGSTRTWRVSIASRFRSTARERETSLTYTMPFKVVENIFNVSAKYRSKIWQCGAAGRS